jgi:hypothetical protein
MNPEKELAGRGTARRAPTFFQSFPRSAWERRRAGQHAPTQSMGAIVVNENWV